MSSPSDPQHPTVGAQHVAPLQREHRSERTQRAVSLRMHWTETLALVAILILAAALRLSWPGVNSFAFDEARLSLIALEMAQGGNFARVGMPSSAGVPNLPAAAWVFSLPYLFSTDPLTATQFVGVVSLLAVVGTWALARRAWGAWAGLVAALFMAASPYSVLYSRSIWAQNLLPALALAWGWTAFLSATRHHKLAIGLHVFLAGFIFQVHFAGAALTLGTLYFFVRFRWWRHLLPVLIGGGLALFTLLPFVQEIACCRPDILDQYQSALGGETHYDLNGFAELLRVALGGDWGYLLLGDLQPPDSPLLVIGVGAVLAVGLINIISIRVVRARHVSPLQDHPIGARILAEIVVVWLLCGPLFFLRHSTPVFVHYLLVALPAIALVAGACVGEGFKPSPTNGKRIRLKPALTGGLNPLPQPKFARFAHLGQPVVFLLTLIVALAWSVQIAQGLTTAEQVGTPNGLGTPLKFTRNAAYGPPADVPVLFFTHGDNPDVDGEAAVFEALWWGREHRIIRGDTLLILPPEPATLMATLQPIQAWEELQAMGLAQDVMTFPRREGLLPFVATDYDGAALQTGMANFTGLDAPVSLNDGTQLRGWKARRVGPRLRISTLWRVTEPPAPGTYQQFHHLRTADTLTTEQPLAISDVPISAQHWRVDDQLVVMGDFFVDDLAQEFWVDIGHYTLPDLQRTPQANGADDPIRLGPFGPMTTDQRNDND